ncbi:hypothetical protein [Armatimonas sp.]|uniref:hypothetical protein n=1 Tax=Armatimonas sp. TaxID=1872638 RepID=UPI00374D7C8A
MITPSNQITHSNRGRKKIPEAERIVNLGICGKRADLEFLLTWNVANPTLAFSELIGELRRVRPAGRHSGPVAPAGCKDAPGTRTSLKKRIKELETRTSHLENQLRAAGLIPL